MEKELVEYIVKALVEKPEEININVVEGEQNTILELRVAADEIGKVIGKQGRIAKAIRTILASIGMKSGKHIQLEIID